MENETRQNDKPLQPEEITPIDMPENPRNEIVRDIPKGYVVVVEIDSEGNEKEGTEFMVLESGYYKRYNDPKRFKLKKKVK